MSGHEEETRPSRPPGWRRALPPTDEGRDQASEHSPEQSPEQSPAQSPAQGAGPVDGAAEPGRRRGKRAATVPEVSAPDDTAPEDTAPEPSGPASDQPVAEARPGRRQRFARRFDPVLLLSLLIPLATVAALATVHPGAAEDDLRGPGETPLDRALLVCPAGLPGSADVSVALADPAASGRVTVRAGEPLAVQPGQVTARQTSETVILEGTEESAVGLFALRGDATLGTACQAPRSDVWFTGVGAGPEHTSRLRLVNPDSGPAVADVEVLTSDGTVEVRALRGLTVAPNQETVVDLDAVVPDRHDMSLRVTVPRGRLALSMTDTFAEIGSDVSARSWLGPQRAGSRTLHLLGVRKGGGERTLVVANAGTDEARVDLKLLTEESEFAPDGGKPITVPPGSTTTVDLSRLLRSEDAADVVGVRLDSEVPVTATLRTVSGARVQHTVAAPQVKHSAATVVPGGGGTLLVSGAERMTDVVLQQRDARGRALKSRTIPVAPRTVSRVKLSGKARTLVLEVGGVPVRAALVARGAAPAQVWALEELPVNSPVPVVRPALQ